MTQTSAPDPKLVAAKRMRLIVMLIYYVAVSAGAYWLWHGHVYITRWADDAALAVGLICVLVAARLLYESFSKVLLSDRMQVEGDPTRRETNQARVQAALIFLLGVVLVLPNVAFGLGWPRQLVYGGIVLFVVVRTLYTLRALRSADEFIRRRMFEAGWWTMLLTTTGLLLYGGAERLGLVRVATSWDVMIIVFAIAIVTPSFLFKKPKPAPQQT
ncbi:MAG TPA: hypothetical protein VGL66_16025 [Caulobacteraceae bacterium]|jgi:hypothetical protein